MIKQIFNKLPKKSSSSSLKSSQNDLANNKMELVSVNSVPVTIDLKVCNNNDLVPVCYELLPNFKLVSNSEKQTLLIKKLNMCCVIFEFNDSLNNSKEKDVKKQTLLELVEYISSATSKFNEITVQEITKMVASNLFRALPNSRASSHEYKLQDIYDQEDDEFYVDPSWPHLQIVYEFLLRFVASPETDSKLTKRYINHSFVVKLLELFDSEDQREREYLKTILHRIYGKFMVHRPFIRKAINNVFYRVIFENGKHNGIAELLELLGSIINGFALPLKEEHRFFLVHVLIPLHKPRFFSVYQQQLVYCVSQFIEKDSKLADIVIRGLLKCWPVTNSSKEVMYLSELEEILEATKDEEFERCMVPLFRQIGCCLNSSHFQVAERALFLWNNEHIRNLITKNRKVILPIIFAPLEKNRRAHWNQAVQTLTLNVRKIFSDADHVLFQECLVKYQENELNEKESLAKRQLTWNRLEAMVVSRLATSVTINATATTTVK